MTVSLSQLLEDSFQIAWEYLEQSGELGDGAAASRFVDNARLVNQIAALERRTSRGGKDSIDLSPGAHDDVANVVAGLAHCAINRHIASVTAAWLFSPIEAVCLRLGSDKFASR